MSTSPESGDSRTTIPVLEDEDGLDDPYTTWLSDEYGVRTAYTATEARNKFDQDPDILFEPTGNNQRDRRAGRIIFPYCESLVTVHADSEIVISSKQEAS